MGTGMLDKAEVDDFVSEVDRVAKLIDDISSGELSIEEYDRMHGRELQKQAAVEAQRKAEAEAAEARRETDAAEMEQRRSAAKLKVRARLTPRLKGSRRCGGWVGGDHADPDGNMDTRCVRVRRWRIPPVRPA
jgi:hypothetical protein